MRIDILTLFPEMFDGPLTESIIRRATASGRVIINRHQLRDSAVDKHGTVDDTPYGGGSGMVLKVDVIDRALESIIETGKQSATTRPTIILLTPQGEQLNQKIARSLAKTDWLILVCGHYEGVDERVRSLVDREISIGDYILTGGELPAMVVADAVIRLLPGVLGNEYSSHNESHESGLLEYPQYTRPDSYKEMVVPAILLSGDHAAIERWRHEQSVARTHQRRPDLIKNSDTSAK